MYQKNSKIFFFQAQECDFNFNIDENDKREEIDASVVEIRSVLSAQNFDKHESELFPNEDLSIEFFFKLIKFAERSIEKAMEEEIDISTTPKITKKIKIFLKKISKLEKFKSMPNLDPNIRVGSRRNYIKTLKELFSISNREIFKSEYFKKLLKEEQLTIPLACDIKC